MKQEDIKEYLTEKNIHFKKKNGELITKCIFNDCDKDSRPNEAHLYFSKETGQYHCKKCNEKGNLTTLKKYFGDTQKRNYKNKRFNTDLVYRCHSQLPERIRDYLNKRGIKDEVINRYKIGYGTFYGKNFITIPVKDKNGYQFFKLRQDPQDGNEKITYPAGKQSQLYGMYAPKGEDLIFCEGEFDALALIAQGYYALTSTHGAGTFKEEWINDDILNAGRIFVCFDNDEAGKKGSEKVLKILNNNHINNLA